MMRAQIDSVFTRCKESLAGYGIKDRLSLRMAMATILKAFDEGGYDITQAATPEEIADVNLLKSSDGTIAGELKTFGWEPPIRRKPD